MPTFLMAHRHSPGDYGIAYAAWRRFKSPLRRRSTLASCIRGGHAIWWTVAADDPERALAQLPPFVADRTEAIEVREVSIP